MPDAQFPLKRVEGLPGRLLPMVTLELDKDTSRDVRSQWEPNWVNVSF